MRTGHFDASIIRVMKYDLHYLNSEQLKVPIIRRVVIHTQVCIFPDSSDGITSASGVSLRKVNYASNSASAILMMVFQFVKDNSAIHRKITECLADHKDDLTKGIIKEQLDRPTDKNKTKKFILLLILKSVSSMILLFYYLPPQQNETMLS